MLIPTIDTLKENVAFLASDIEFTDIQAYLELAELLVIDELTGLELFTDIDANQEDPTYADVVKLCRQVIAHLAFYEGIPFLDVVLTSNGFAIVSNNNLKPASKERVEKLRNQALVLSDKFSEALLDYLEATVAFHAKWKPSQAYLRYSDCLIKTAKELSRYSDFQENRTEYQKKRSDILNFTASHLHPYLSKDLMDELITQQNDGTLTDPNKLILPKIKQVLGCLLNRKVREAEIMMGDVLGIIDTNLDNYPTYTASSEYAGRIAEDYVNEAETGIFVFGR